MVDQRVGRAAGGLAIQQAVARSSSDDASGEALVVKVGLNAGEPVAEDDDLFGTVVQLAQRAYGTRPRVGRSSPRRPSMTWRRARASCSARVEQRQLKGFDAPVPLWPVELPSGSGEDSVVHGAPS